MSIFEEILGGVRSGRESRKRYVTMGIAGSGPDAELIGSCFKEAECVSDVVYYHPKEKKAERNAGLIGARAVCDEKEFIDSIGAAFVMSLPDGRNEIVESLLKAGVHVILSKPFAEDSAEAERLYKISKKSGTKLAVFDEAFYFQPYRKLKELIDKMEIGELCAARFKFNLCGDGGWGPHEDLLESNCGVYHPCFDVIPYAADLLGNVESVVAYMNPMLKDGKKSAGGQSVIAMKLRAPGCYAVIELSYSPKTSIRTKGWPCDASIELAGTDGIIWANHFYGKLTETPWIEIRRGKKYFSLGIGSGLDVEWEDAVRDCAVAFAESAAYGSPLKQDIKKHLHAVRVVSAAIESSSSNESVRID